MCVCVCVCMCVCVYIYVCVCVCVLIHMLVLDYPLPLGCSDLDTNNVVASGFGLHWDTCKPSLPVWLNLENIIFRCQMQGEISDVINCFCLLIAKDYLYKHRLFWEKKNISMNILLK